MAEEVHSTILKSLPPKTPQWAVGLISIIVSTSFCLIIFYTTVRSEVQSYMKEREVTTTTEVTLNQKMTESILNLVSANNQQISNLSASLYAAQRDAERQALEIENIREKLGNCEKNCIKILK